MERMMDAIVKPAAGPGLELRRVPVPVPGPGEVLIKIHKTAICGTDVHIYNWDPWAREHITHPPMTIGHEYVGEIAALGAGEGGPAGLRRGPYHLPPLPQLPHGQHPVVPQHHQRGRGPGRRLRGICLHPRDQCDPHRREPAGGCGGLLRRLRQRHPHGPHVGSGGRGCFDHRRRPHWHHRRGHLQICRRAAGHHHRPAARR